MVGVAATGGVLQIKLCDYEIMKYSQENNCVGVSLKQNCRPSSLQLY